MSTVTTLPKTKNEKRFVCITDTKQRGLIEKIRAFMEAYGRKTFSELRMSGGLDGDLGEEIAEIIQYKLHTGATAQTYTLLDNGANGYAELASVLVSGTDEGICEILEFLDKHDFVNKHASLKERPAGYKDYAGYLDDWYYPARKKPFSNS